METVVTDKIIMNYEVAEMLHNSPPVVWSKKFSSKLYRLYSDGSVISHI